MFFNHGLLLKAAGLRKRAQLTQAALLMISSKKARSVIGAMLYGSKLEEREYFK